MAVRERRYTVSSEPTWEQTTITRVAAGDAGALAELYDQFGGFVFGLARRITRDVGIAEEVTQDVFCRLWQQPSAFDAERGQLRTFLGTMAHRRSVDRVRQSEAARRRELAQGTHVGRGDQPDIAEEFTAYLRAEDVRAAVAELPEEQRRPIVLAYFEGCTFRELARKLDIPEGTAKSRVRLALAKLGVALTAQGTTI